MRKVKTKNIPKQRPLGKFKKWSFEYIYMILMVIYMGQMMPETSRMVMGLSGNPIPLLIPIIATGILLYRNHISWRDKNLYTILAIVFVWIVAITIKQADYSIGFQSYNLFLIYSIIIAFIHIKVFGRALPDIYEDIIVKLSIISVPLWCFAVLLPDMAEDFFRMFPQTQDGTASGNNFLYIYKWIDESRVTAETYDIQRNSGFSWEPGRYAIILSLAILNNISNRGIKIIGNWNLSILLAALITTFSTTGYLVVAAIFIIFFIKNISWRSIARFLFVVVPLLFFLFNLDFIGEKIEEKMDLEELNEKFIQQEAWNATHGGLDEHISLDRFQSMFFDGMNVMEDPIIGYSRDASKSWFGQNFIEDYSLTGGFLKIFAQFGLLLGLYFYYILFRSSRALSEGKKYKRPMALFIVMILCSVSYAYFVCPVFMAFWFMGAFDSIPNKLFIVGKTKKKK